jgi:hypothetical protein
VFDTTTHVTLSATPSEGSVFAGWSGNCSGTGTCTVAMEHLRTVNAVFDAADGQTYTMSVTPEGEGHGVVRSAPSGITCPPTCSASFQPGTNVTLTATPDSRSLFDGWADDCTGAGQCRLMMNQARFVKASFISRVYRPDAAIRSKGRPFVGDDVRGGTGVSQTVTVKRRPGSRVVFTIRASNLGNVADRFRFHGGGDHGPFHVRYLAGFTGTIGITRQVVNGTFLTSTVARGDSRVIRLVVDIGPAAKARSEWTWQIVVASANRSISHDVVGAHLFVLKLRRP